MEKTGRKGAARGKRVVGMQAERGKIAERTVYKTVDGEELTALIYRRPRKEGDGLSPVCFWFHGGSWTGGHPWEPELLPLFLRRLNDLGVAVISCQYRLCSETNHWTEMMADCSDFIRFFAARTGELGLDMDRVFTCGASAGGHLSLMEALAGDRFGQKGTAFPKIRFVVDLCGPVTLGERLNWEHVKNPEKHYRLLFGPDPSGWRSSGRQISPLYIAEELPPAALMPVIAVHSTHDELVSPRQPERLRDCWERAGREFRLVVVQNGSHAFGNIPGLPPAEPAQGELQRILGDFVEAHL